MTEHTPAPWNAASAYSSICGVPIISRTGKRIGNTAIPDMPPEWDNLKKEAVANAAYLCMCVNSHDALVTALEQIAGGTIDLCAPFRAMPREYMQRIASEALSRVSRPVERGERP